MQDWRGERRTGASGQGPFPIAPLVQGSGDPDGVEQR